MTTKLDGPLKRELEINGIAHTLVIEPEGLKLTIKGRQLGHELRWADLVSGEAALATALNASLATANRSRPASAADASTAKSKKTPVEKKRKGHSTPHLRRSTRRG